MGKRPLVLLSFCLVAVATTLLQIKSPLKNGHAGRRGISPVANARIVEAYGKLPLSFEANQGQTDSDVKFLSRGGGYSLFLTSTEAVLSLKKSGDIQNRDPKGAVKPSGEAKAVVRMKLIGANTSPQVTGIDELPGKTNYFIGNDPKKWRTNVPTYAKVKYKRVYPGIDLVYYGNQQQLEYDFIVSPGANPNAIR